MAMTLMTVMPVSAQDWNELGPAPIVNGGYAGRVSAIVCSPTDANRYFVAGADAGIWRTVDGGQTWSPLTDDMPSTAIGALAMDPTDENTIYAGTGEANFANHSRYGLGLYKTVDGGETWAHLAEATFGGRCFSRIVVDHAVPTTVYAAVTRAGGFPELAAAKGHPGATAAVGVFKSVDGGISWVHLAGGLPALSATDLAIDPTASNIIYAAIGRIFGDAANGIYKSIDGGASWTKLAGGLPTTDVGRVSVAVAPSDSSRLYTLITQASNLTGGSASTRGAYRSDDGGATWSHLTQLSNIQASYGWYLSVVSVKPDDPDTVFLGGFSLRRTTNGGSSFNNVTPPHVDLHALAWDASGRLVAGDDGGVHRTGSLGNSWISLNDGLGSIQFYAGLSTHPTNPNIVFGGTQDNGSNRRDTNSTAWTQVFGGDGGWTQLDITNPQRVFVEFQGTGNLYRSTNGGNSFSSIGGGINGSDRNCFLPPFLINAGDPSRMLYATHRVYRSVNGGSSWVPISADLTDGAGAIRAMAQAPSHPGVVYAATNDGNVLVSLDEGETFTLIVDDHPGWPRVTREIEVSERDPLRAYLAGAVFKADQIRRTIDGGATWQALDGNLPDLPVNVIAEGPLDGQLLAGTDAGIWVSDDDGLTWSRYGNGLPNVPVIDLRLDHAHGRVVAATQGRGVWSAPLLPVLAGLTDFDLTFGSLLGGDLQSVRFDDGSVIHCRSQFGFSAREPNLLEMKFGATAAGSGDELIIEIASRLSQGGGRARITAMDWSTGVFTEIEERAIGVNEERVRIEGLDASRFVRAADGRVEVKIRHIALLVLSIHGFESFVDLVQISRR